MPGTGQQFTAFQGTSRLVSGSLAAVASAVQAATVGGCGDAIRIFDDASGSWVEFDLLASRTELSVRPASTAPAVGLCEVEGKRGRGRPPLGVLAREVTLSPGHWRWLNAQPGGASVVLRRLIDNVRRSNQAGDSMRRRQEAAYHFLTVMANGLPGVDDVLRALFADERARFRLLIATWPTDIALHAVALVDGIEDGPRTPPSFGVPAAPAAPAAPVEPVEPVAPTVAAHPATSAERRWHSPLADLMPPGVCDAALDLLASAFGSNVVESAARLAGRAWGPSAAFRISVSGAAYALRVDAAPSAFADPERQYACLNIAGEAGIGPRLIRADVGLRMAVTEFIEADEDVEREDWHGGRVTAIVDSLKTLHAAPTFPGLMPYLDCVEILMERVRGARVLSPAIWDTIQSPFNELRSGYRLSPGDVVSSHNDLNPFDVLFTAERARFVDWHTAFAADRYVDLASVANFCGNSSDVDYFILQAYSGCGYDPLGMARMYLMRQATRLFHAMVLLDAVATARPATRLSVGDLRAVRDSTPTLASAKNNMRTLASVDGQLRFACLFLNDFQFHARQGRFGECLVIASSWVTEAV